MINALLNFFYMNGHGWFVWSAYSITFFILAIQWFIPWRRWKRFLNEQNS